MNGWMDSLLIGLVLMNLILVASGRLSACIKIVAFQGIGVGLLPLVVHTQPVLAKTIFLVVVIIGLKGFVFPWFLSLALREANVRRDVEPFIGYPISMLVYVLSFMLSLWFSSRLPMPHESLSSLIVPVSFSTILCGFFIIVSRAKALTQVLGYLVVENGIYIFGIAMLLEQSMMIELAILLDIFAGVFVMGITIFHISREFDHIDTQQLTALKDWPIPKGEILK